MTSGVKCARCSQPVTEFPVSTLAEVSHQHCWALLSSKRLRKKSRNRIKSSEEHVSKTLNRLRTRRPFKEPLLCPVCLKPIDQPHSLIHEECDYTTRERVVSKPESICGICAAGGRRPAWLELGSFGITEHEMAASGQASSGRAL